MRHLDQTLAELGARIGIAALAFDADGTCRLETESYRIELQRNAEGSRLLLSCLAGELPDNGREAALLRLMAANAFFSGTFGATLGVPAGSGAVALAREFEAAHLDPASLEQALSRFMRAADAVPGLLAGPGDAGQEAVDPHAFMTMTRV